MIGRVLAEFGPKAALSWQGKDVFCGTMRRFVHVYRLRDVGLTRPPQGSRAGISSTVQLMTFYGWVRPAAG
jgi:hypothetical protein